MKLLKKYQKYIGKYEECRSAFGRKCLRKCGFGPEYKIVDAVKDEVVKEIKPKKTRKTKKKSTK